MVNTGSPSLKLHLLDGADRLERSADLPSDGDGFDTDPLRDTIVGWAPPDTVGHRVVHGGSRFTGPTLIDSGTEAQLRELSDLAPLHQPKSLAAVDAVTALRPCGRGGGWRTHPPPSVSHVDWASRCDRWCARECQQRC